MFFAALTVALCLSNGYCVVAGERVTMIGNEIKASVSGVDEAGTTVLMSEVVLEEGVVFAYSAFFRSEKPVRFQIWRPVENVSESYQLVGETRVIPAVNKAREDIYIESKLTEKCVRVQKGDRLGVYNEKAPAAVAYTFDANSPEALLYIPQNSSEVSQLKDVIKFGALNFPYVFSVLAYMDTNMSLYNDTTEEFPACPKGLRIPPYGIVTLPTTPPPTGRPGATGATGPAGIQGVTGANGTTGEKGDVGATGEQGVQGATGPVGYNGSVGATGPEGPMGVNGSAGEKGVKGDVGATGAMGPSGPRGLPGPAGETVTLPTPIAAKSKDEDNSMFSDPNFVMALFIWLIILTILFIIVVIVVLVVRRRRRGDQRPPPGSKIVYSERVQSHLYENDPKWLSDMKEETETNYSNNTLTADGTERDDQRPTSFDYTNECDKQFDYVNGEQVKAGVTSC